MAWWAWVVLGIICIAIETILTGDFSLFCVGVSAFIVAGVARFFPAIAGGWQFLTFGAISVIVLLMVRRPLLGRFKAHRGADADFHYLVGEVATPDDDLPANGVGRAELRGSIWTARNGQASELHKGQRCRVERVEGLTLWLREE